MFVLLVDTYSSINAALTLLVAPDPARVDVLHVRSQPLLPEIAHNFHRSGEARISLFASQTNAATYDFYVSPSLYF